jgi:hypothetical protein
MADEVTVKDGDKETTTTFKSKAAADRAGRLPEVDKPKNK